MLVTSFRKYQVDLYVWAVFSYPLARVLADLLISHHVTLMSTLSGVVVTDIISAEHFSAESWGLS